MEKFVEAKVPVKVAFFLWTAAMGKFLAIDNLKIGRCLLLTGVYVQVNWGNFKLFASSIPFCSWIVEFG